ILKLWFAQCDRDHRDLYSFPTRRSSDLVKNADDVVAGKKKVETLGVKADDNQHLTVTLDRRIPYFKLLMGFGVFFPQNEHAVERSEEHTSELQSRFDLVCRLLLEKKKET